MSRFADIRTEWRVDVIEQSLSRKADSHEVSTLNGNVDRLERANRELSSEVSNLRSQLERLEEVVNRIQQNQEEHLT